MGPFTSFIGGYITNPDATSGCLYCPYRTTDQFMLNNFNIEYAHHWRNLGIIMGVVLFNVRSLFALISSPMLIRTLGICDIHPYVYIPYQEGQFIQETIEDMTGRFYFEYNAIRIMK